MLEEILDSIHNWFFVDNAAVYDTFKIESGEITLPFLKNGQYFKIEGSIFNDGVHKYGEAFETDEEFTGYILPMAIPKTFLNLVTEIESWQENYGSKAAGPYQSESFGGYSYSKATGSTSGTYTWKDAFKSRLSVWRKI